MQNDTIQMQTAVQMFIDFLLEHREELEKQMKEQHRREAKRILDQRRRKQASKTLNPT